MIIKRIAGFTITVEIVAYYNYHTNNCAIMIIYDYVARIGTNSA